MAASLRASSTEKGLVLNDFLNVVSRWTVRLVLLMVGVVFFLSLLSLACVLAAVWGLRALWAKITGQPIAPWVMPLRTASSWASKYQRAGQFGGMGSAATATTASAQEDITPFAPSAGSKRGGILAHAAAEVSDVQAREVR